MVIRRIGLRVATLVTAGASLAACRPSSSGPQIVEALVPDDTLPGSVRLDDTELSTVIDLGQGTGEGFDVRGGLFVKAQDIQASLDERDDYEGMLARVRGDEGEDLDLRMHHDGTRWIAEDFETLLYFTLFENFEEARAFALQAGDTSAATSRKAIISLFGDIRASDLIPLQLITTDNAAYVPPIDGWLALRVGEQEGVPLAMHRGVISHEFGHRLFFHNVVAGVPGGFSAWQQRAVSSSGESPDAALVRSEMLFKGIDEGLADVFSISTLRSRTSIASAFTDSVVFASEADFRDVEGPFAAAATYDNLALLQLDASLRSHCGLDTENFNQASWNFYCIGTVLAAALWEGSDRDATTLATVIEPAVIQAMPVVGVRVASGELFDVDFFLEALAAALPSGSVHDATCRAFSSRFTSLVDGGKVPSCF